MSTVIEMYNRISQRFSAILEKSRETEQSIRQLRSGSDNQVQARILRLEEQLVKIDEYLLKIDAFRKLAERNLASKNLQTIEAPPGYRVNLNRLRQWAMMIDPMSSDDPYAQRVYLVAKCDELFLKKKQTEFNQRIAALRKHQDVENAEEIRRLEMALHGYEEELRDLCVSGDMASFARGVTEANNAFWFSSPPQTYKNPLAQPGTVSPGAYAVPLDPAELNRPVLKNMFGRFYDADGARVLLPVEIGTESEFAMEIACSPIRTKQLDRGIQNLVLSIINRYPAGENKVFILDAVRFNTSSIGSLRLLEDTFALAPVPRNPEQLSAALEEIVSSFSDLDESLELFDSVIEYNRERGKDKEALPRRTLVIFGWPNAYEGSDRELLHRIMTNYERYGISFLCVSYRNDRKKEQDESTLPGYAAQNAIQIRMLPKDTFIQTGDGAASRFTWYTLTEGITADYAGSLRNVLVGKKLIGNEYTNRYSLTALPPYVREYLKIELPFGIDGKDEAHRISFENENFATYLVGASRSGKSTLLHTLIAGLIRNYHPDNVELWLADFKQLEFKRYIRHLPPHVKYVLLDESTELVYDLVDKLTDKMLERQKLFARLGVQRIDQVDPLRLDAPLPVIFVILDEFSIMSQSLAESPIYRLRLQNILAKGAALGIKFLFSSQTFTTGVAGLTATARAQIQQRIAMKGSRDEISATLELSANLKTDQVRNWMDALPPHYALVKFRKGADTLPEVKRYLVMYFQEYAPRDQMIEQLRSKMQPSQKYEPDRLELYVDKQPVLVDGNTYEAFAPEVLRAGIRAKAGTDDAGDERYLAFGSPRLMERIKLLTLTMETRENLLLVARAAEQACAASILYSAIRAFRLQGGKVQIWAYGRNPLLKTYRTLFSRDASLVEGMDAVCDAIRSLKQDIRDRVVGDRLILLVGMDRICMDFDFLESGGSGQPKEENPPSIADLRESFVASGATVSNETEEARLEKAQAWVRHKDELREQLKSQGKARGEISALLAEEKERFFQKWEETHPITPFETDTGSAVQISAALTKPEQPEEEPISGAYAAQGDFTYVVKQGSKLGYHFLLALNALADLKSCGLKPDYFRYRMAFQLSVEDSRSLFGNKGASTLPEHICQFDDSLERYSFRPYLHPGISWEGWSVDETGKVQNPFGEGED